MTVTKLLAYHGDPKIKRKYLARVRAHRKADELVKGRYWESGKGCAVGCTVHSSSHAAYETELGIPRELARLEDQIFERLDNGASKAWPEAFLQAPRVGADLSMVWPSFALWLLSEAAAARQAFWLSARDKLLQLMREAPIDRRTVARKA